MMAEGNDSPELDAERLRPLIDGALDRLSDSDREVILLRFYRGSAFGDIARRCGISEDAARFRLNRALERVKRLLLKSGISSSPAALTLVFAESANAASTAGLVNAVSRGALAKASAAGSAGVSLTQTLQIMSNTKVIAAAAVLIACTGGFLLHREHAKLAEIRAELVSRKNADQRAPRQFVNTRPDQQAAHEQIQIVAKFTPSAPVITNRSSAPHVAPTSTAQSTATSSVEAKKVNWALSRDPEIRAALAAWIGSAVRASFAAFYRSANLSADQIVAFEALALEQDTNMGQAVLTLRPENKTLSEVTSDLRELLGDDVYQQYRRYSQTQCVRAVALGLAGFVHDTDSPLSAEQAEQLTQIFAESSPNYQEGRFPFPKDIDWTTALPRARGILTESQFTALNDLATMVPSVIGGLNPARSGMFGEGTNPPPSLYTLGGKSK